MPAKGRGKVDALTSLRSFAALYVVFFHAFPREVVVPGSFASKFLDHGFISVDFFFVLSGYILGLVYLSRKRNWTVRSFAVSRFARIYPIFLVTLIADTPRAVIRRAALYGMHVALLKTAGTVLGHVLMLQAWTPKLMFLINQPDWSLSVETFFYLCFPLLGPALWRIPRRWILLTMSGLWILSQSAVWFLAHRTTAAWIVYNPVCHLQNFALGILLCSMQRHRGPLPLQPRTVWCLLAGSALVLCSAIYASPFLSQPNLFDGLLDPVFMCIIAALWEPTTALAKGLSHRALVLLGEASYGLYLIHAVVLHLYPRAGSQVRHFILYLVACIALSVISFTYLESPARKYLLRRLGEHSREPLAAASIA